MLGDKPERLVGEQVVSVQNLVGGISPARVADGCHLVGQQDLVFVAPEKVREVVMGVDLVQVTEEVIEALFARQTRLGRSHIPESPFAHKCRGIAGSPQCVGHGQVIFPQRLSRRVGAPRVAPHSRMSVMLARHEDRARRCTDGRTRVELREPHSLTRHAIELRCADLLLAVTTQVAVTEIVRHDPDHIRPLGGNVRRRSSGPKQGQDQQRQSKAGHRIFPWGTNRQNRDFAQNPATNGNGFSCRCGSTDLAGGPTALYMRCSGELP